jgi:hypothetical protein
VLEVACDAVVVVAVDDEFCGTPAAEARLLPACWSRDADGAGGGEAESGAEPRSALVLEDAGGAEVCIWRTTVGKPEPSSVG